MTEIVIALITLRVHFTRTIINKLVKPRFTFSFC